MKNKKIKIAHIIVIIAAILFLSVGLLNTNIWFDEAYSVQLVEHNVSDIVEIGGADVHPVAYYILLKAFVSIFGTSIFMFRLFSLIPVVILLILGFTQVRKEFGEKVGIMFTTLVGFLPITFHYATQIRMYSLAMLLVYLTFIYAYKIIKEGKIKNWILFMLFSVMSAYTHHFAMIVIVVINVALLILILKTKKEYFKTWIIFGIAQGVLFLPGIVIFLKQALSVAKGFWITIKFPNVFAESHEYFFKDMIDSRIPFIFSIILFAYLITVLVKNYKKEKNAQDSKKLNISIIGFAIFYAVIILTIAVSTLRPIYMPRYTIPMIGIFALSIAIILDKEKSKVILGIIFVSIISLSIFNATKYTEKFLDEKNNEALNFVKENIEEDDIFIYTSINTGTVMLINFDNNKHYFYNKDLWGVEEAYKAFAPAMEVIYDYETIVKEAKGNVWVIDSNYTNMDEIVEGINGINKIIEKQEFYAPYSEDHFVITKYELVK